jgi:hypothetical protein
VEKLGIADSEIPRHLACRAVDDQHVATARKLDLGKKFTTKNKNICKIRNIGLAEDCDDYDKVFSNTKRGKVLGVWLDSIYTALKLPEEKVQARRIEDTSLRSVLSKEA